jgi:putative transposase
MRYADLAGTQILVHFVFAVKDYEPLILSEVEGPFYQYLAELIEKRGHHLIVANGMQDHIHILLGLKPTENVSELVKVVKRASTIWMRNRFESLETFSWEPGYAAISCSRRSMHQVVSYIRNQKAHHSVKTFQEECDLFLNYLRH